MKNEENLKNVREYGDKVPFGLSRFDYRKNGEHRAMEYGNIVCFPVWIFLSKRWYSIMDDEEFFGKRVGVVLIKILKSRFSITINFGRAKFGKQVSYG